MGEGLLAVLCKVAIYFPLPAKVMGPLDEHGLGSERLEGHNKMGEVELGFQIQLDVHVLFAVLRLPPPGSSVLERGNNIFDAVTPLPFSFCPGSSGVAVEALGVLFQVTDHAVSLLAIQAAGGGGGEIRLTTNQQIAGGRVTAAQLAGWLSAALSEAACEQTDATTVINRRGEQGAMRGSFMKTCSYITEGDHK